MTASLYKDCPRCSGTGIYAGRGWCFACAGNGEYIRDTFLRAVGLKGDFFGATYSIRHGVVGKEVVRGRIDALQADADAGCVFTPITEEQARKFFKRYGTRTEIAA